MMKSLLSLGLILYFLVPFPAQAQDPGVPDTVYFKAGTPCSTDGDTLYITPDGKVYIQVWLWADDDSVRFAIVPLTNTAYGPPSNAYLDTLDNGGLYYLYPPAFNGCVASCCYYYLNVEGYPPAFQLMVSSGWVYPLYLGAGLFATLTYTVSDTGTICLDTTVFPTGNRLGFFSHNLSSWVPQFFSRCFPVRYSQRPLLQVSALKTDTVIVGEPFSFTIQVKDPLGELLEDDARLILRSISTGQTYFGTGYGTNHINRISGQGTSEGTWEVDLAPPGTGEFTYEMKFSGVNGAAGFDTTRVFLFSERGDVNDDGEISVSDVIKMILCLFKSWPGCDWEIYDCNCDGVPSITDIVYLINYLFKNGPRPLCY